MSRAGDRERPGRRPARGEGAARSRVLPDDRGVGAPAAPPAAAAAGDRVGLVVRIDEDRVEVRTVPYEQGMTGLDVLLSSGLEVEAAYSSLGAAVCSIAGQAAQPPTASVSRPTPGRTGICRMASGPTHRWAPRPTGSSRGTSRAGLAGGTLPRRRWYRWTRSLCQPANRPPRRLRPRRAPRRPSPSPRQRAASPPPGARRPTSLVGSSYCCWARRSSGRSCVGAGGGNSCDAP